MTGVVPPQLQRLVEPAGDALAAKVIQVLRQAGTPCYLVGGTIRDALLSLQPSLAAPCAIKFDLDFAVPANGLRIARQIADWLGGAFYPLDARRDVGRVVFSIGPCITRVVDVARFQGDTLTDDLARRDFSVNAMALDVSQSSPVLIDPHGGYLDLQAALLRALSGQSMQADPLRCMRAVRLRAQLGFEIEAGTRALIQAAAPQLHRVSPERVRDELMKILALPAAAGSIRLMDALGLLISILPATAPLKGLAQAAPHRWDVFEHTLRTVEALEVWLPVDGAPAHPDLPFAEQIFQHLAVETTGGYRRRWLLTLAALLHDIGKPATLSVESGGRTRFIGHELAGAALSVSLLQTLRFPRQAVHRVEAVVQHHLRPLSLAWQGAVSQRAIHRFYRDLRDAGVEVAVLALADHQATVGPPSDDSEWPVLLDTVRQLLDAYFNRHHAVVAPPPLLDGHELVQQFGLAPGPQLGQLLAALREAQAAGVVTTREQAQAWVREHLTPNI